MTVGAADQQQSTDLRAVAFYLPGIHPIPENDANWGEGFTEWRNVAKATPLFEDHYQPHIPGELGFYDLRLPETREAQARLARAHGIHGFCYYHYWFQGRRLLERPFEEVLASGSPGFPFCLCWANEPWTRAWDGATGKVVVPQGYNAEDDLAHIRALMPAFRDPRYIKVEGKPVFLIYRASELPDPVATTKRWRDEAARGGLEGLYLVRVEGPNDISTDPRDLGFDAGLEFQPRWNLLANQSLRSGWKWRLLEKLGVSRGAYAKHRINRYDALVERSLARTVPDWPCIRSVCVGFDNSPRRAEGAWIFSGSTPEKYGEWLRRTAAWSRTQPSPGSLIFINAWNEWAEGNHLEPCRKFGRAYLEATAAALRNS